MKKAFLGFIVLIVLSLLSTLTSGCGQSIKATSTPPKMTAAQVCQYVNQTLNNRLNERLRKFINYDAISAIQVTSEAWITNKSSRITHQFQVSDWLVKVRRTGIGISSEGIIEYYKFNEATAALEFFAEATASLEKIE